MEPSLSPEDVDVLFELADFGVREGLAGRPAPVVDPAMLEAPLRRHLGVFVTLEVAGELNGCIGTVEAVQEVGPAVPRLAWAAAFSDFRLPALTAADYPDLGYKLSLMTPLEGIPSGSEEEVLRALRPGVDGLVIRHGQATGTFLPAVWAKVPEPLEFLRHLETKAGLRPGHWPAGMRAWRYQADEHRRRAVDIPRRSAA
ncbi:MAG TPA: AmmeMemoRadiSam system protein A [Acidimicrobiales bacterium]|nr:AmmeMemoRadiSam system protein A [Acidimicrobiales bacterium]